MNKLITILLVCICFQGCSQKQKIKSKTEAVLLDKSVVFCNNDEDTADPYGNCIIKINDTSYLKRYTFVYNDNSSFDKLYYYKPEGPLVYSKNDIINDKGLYKVFKNNITFNFKIDINNRQIEDSTVTHKYEEIVDRKYIVIKKQGKNVLIYELE